MRRSFSGSLAVLSLLMPACVTEQTVIEQIQLSIPADAVRAVILGTGGSPSANDPRGIPRDPASLLLLPDGTAPILVDPWAGCVEKIAEIMRARPRGSEEPDPPGTPTLVLLTTANPETVAGIHAVSTLQSQAADGVRPRLVATEAILERLARLDPTATDRYRVVALQSGDATSDLLGGISVEAIDLPGNAGSALRIRGPRRSVLYMPRGALPQRASNLDPLLLGVDAAILDGSGIGHGLDPTAVLDRCLRWGVPRGHVQFTSITLENPGFPPEATAVGHAIAEDGFELWL